MLRLLCNGWGFGYVGCALKLIVYVLNVGIVGSILLRLRIVVMALSAFLFLIFQDLLFPSSSVLSFDVGVEPVGWTISLLDRLFSLRLRSVKSIPPKCRLGFARVLKGALDGVAASPGDLSCWIRLFVLPLCILKTFSLRSNLECRTAVRRQRQEESITSAILAWGMPGGSLQLMQATLDEVPPSFHMEEDLDLSELNIRQCRRKICDGHYIAAVRVLSSSGITPYSNATLVALHDKHPVAPSPSLPPFPVDHHPLVASSAVVLDIIKSFPSGTSCGRDGFRAQHLMDCLSGAVVAISDDLTASIARVVNFFLEGRCP
ncbi:hypothetical protein RND81_05G153200 [Saponaria officinalis]|uniref:Uncharacterized protein n=1 Tax=Saponaria officinalis TaxID=3572 RepID=A0AAW1L188_SAPOF